ncbi:PREDICTED: uncharacterized protein LOC108562723 isoform X2 [Nicrophorus vespilloides]|uniref:Uncharacterized protein LOC108562723 isoform X2 n=1 Tax=Nicrophorus vespilloides TaxID=110193 RepID=A0ABM1MPX8_NICVS|nr:PREDICTED: uncharacterized protein LOC108562723 isoform X2 [Nicrophorus vespilloides]
MNKMNNKLVLFLLIICEVNLCNCLSNCTVSVISNSTTFNNKTIFLSDDDLHNDTECDNIAVKDEENLTSNWTWTGTYEGYKKPEGTGRKLQFPVCPDGEAVVAESLQEIQSPFSFFSTLMGSLQPARFPLGMLKDVAERRVPFNLLLLQIFKLEGLVCIWIILWTVAALCISCSVASQICCPRRDLQRRQDHSSLSPSAESNKRTLSCYLYILLVLLIGNIVLMLTTNEIISKSIMDSPNRAKTIIEDLQKYVKNTDMQISFVTTTAAEFTTQAIDEDLEDTKELIGIPFQKNLADAFGLLNIFETLRNIRTESDNISKRVKYIMQECQLAREASKLLQEKLDKLVPLLGAMHDYCSQRDRTLCETLMSDGLVVSYNTNEVSSDVKLKYLAGVSTNFELNKNLQEAEMNYKAVPGRVAEDTAPQTEEIRKLLRRHRIKIYKALRMLGDLSSSMISSIKTTSRKIVPTLEELASGDVWRYLVVLGIAIFTFITWIFLICGAPSGCESPHKTIIPYLILGLSLASFVSLLLLVIAAASFLLAVHGTNFICNPLYDPNYLTLSEILDDEGLLYRDGGYLKKILSTNESLLTMDILRKIERNAGAYSTFKLGNKINLFELIDFDKWSDLNTTINRFRITQRTANIFTFGQESNLKDLVAATRVNLTNYRSKILSPVTVKDLNGLMDQAYAVAKQIVDTRTANRLEKFILKLRDVLNNEYKIMSQFKENILYDVTALEVVLVPLREKTELVLGKLRQFAGAVNVDGNRIAEKVRANWAELNEHPSRIQKLKQNSHQRRRPSTQLNHFAFSKLEFYNSQVIYNYSNHLIDYLDQFRSHVHFEIERKVARTKPLWAIFVSTRNCLCPELIDPLNALSFSCFCCIFSMICMVPIARRLIHHYKISSDSLKSIIASSNASPREQIWDDVQPTISSIPSHHSTPRSVDQIAEESSPWASPRPSFNGQHPSPSRPSVATIAAISRSRPRNNRYDSLRSIERTTWRSPGSPKRWI